MYSGTSTAATSLQEEYLLGKRKLNFDEVKAGKIVQSIGVSLNPSWSSKTSLNEKDLESKARDDPLMFIKKKEMEAAQRVISNPLNRRKVQDSRNQQHYLHRAAVQKEKDRPFRK